MSDVTRSLATSVVAALGAVSRSWPRALRSAAGRNRRILGRAAGWVGVITLAGAVLSAVPFGPPWLGGATMAAGYATLALGVASGASAAERRRDVDVRFEQIVAPLRDEMPG